MPSSLKLILLDFQPFTQSERFLREGNGVRFRNNLYDITAYVLSFDSDPNWSVTIWRTQTNAISAISTLRVDTGFEEPQLFLCSPFGARSVEDTDGRLLPYFCLFFTSMKDHLERMGRTTRLITERVTDFLPVLEPVATSGSQVQLVSGEKSSNFSIQLFQQNPSKPCTCQITLVFPVNTLAINCQLWYTIYGPGDEQNQTLRMAFDLQKLICVSVNSLFCLVLCPLWEDEQRPDPN